MKNRLRILNDALSDFTTDEVTALVELSERFIINLDGIVRRCSDAGSHKEPR
ncbi:MAG: hypothetical protein ACE37B_01665 [Ilumatobacter sp.]|uniref:hypothetical protein n=1 Tax=Ilumatobacter sp. TaxID=1967498 RepID=UPI00391A2E30